LLPPVEPQDAPAGAAPRCNKAGRREQPRRLPPLHAREMAALRRCALALAAALAAAAPAGNPPSFLFMSVGAARRAHRRARARRLVDGRALRPTRARP